MLREPQPRCGCANEAARMRAERTRQPQHGAAPLRSSLGDRGQGRERLPGVQA